MPHRRCIFAGVVVVSVGARQVKRPTRQRKCYALVDHLHRRSKWHSMTHCHEIALAIVVRRCCHRRVEVVSRCCRRRRRCGCACRVVLGPCAVVTLWATFVVAIVVAAAPRRGARSPTAGWLSSLSVGPLGLSLALGCGVNGVMGIFAHWSKCANSRFHELSAWKFGCAW